MCAPESEPARQAGVQASQQAGVHIANRSLACWLIGVNFLPSPECDIFVFFRTQAAVQHIYIYIGLLEHYGI